MQVPTHDPNGAEIPKWKREMMAKKAAEKGKKEAIQKRAKEDEERKMAAMPVWKKQLIEKKMDDPKRLVTLGFLKIFATKIHIWPYRERRIKREREKERKRKLILKL